MKCEGCVLQNSCKSPQMVYNGCTNPKILFIVENPSEEEDDRGILFYGKRYSYIKPFINHEKVKDRDVGFLSMVGCYKSSNLTVKDFVRCNSNFQDILSPLLESVKVIFLVGAKVSKALLGNKIAVKEFGKVFKIKGEHYCIPIEDPVGKLSSKSRDRMKSSISKGLLLAFSEVIDLFKLGDVVSADQLEEILPRILNSKSVAFDCETTGLDVFEDGTYLIGVGLYWGEKTGVFIPLQHKDFIQRRLEHERKINCIKKIMYHSKLEKWAFNGGFDLEWLCVHLGVDLNKVSNFSFDVFHAYHMYSETSYPSLSSLVDRYSPDLLGYDSQVDTDWQQYGNMGRFPLKHIVPYCVGDCMATHNIGKKIRFELQKDNTEDLFVNVVMPALKVYTKMSLAGLKLDLDYLEILREKYSEYLSKIEHEIKSSIGGCIWSNAKGEDINPTSPAQISELLYDMWGLEEQKAKRKDKVTRKVTYSRSSAKPALLDLLKGKLTDDQRSFIELLLRYSLIESPLTTFINSAIGWQHDDGLVHPKFNVSGTVTGRLSSSSPNGQNFPSKVTTSDEEVAKFMREYSVKKMFVSKFEGGKMVEADYSQLELRLMAILSNDKEMVETYRDGINSGDIHLTAAKKLFPNFDLGTKEEQSAMRKIAKQKNFEGAYSFDPAFLKMYPGLERYVEDTKGIVRSQGWIANKLGRIRHLPQAKVIRVAERKFGGYSEDWAYLNSLLRQGVNFTIQSLGHDFLELAVVKVDNRLAREGFKSHLCLEVHDSLVCDCVAEEAYQVALIMKEEMESIEQMYDWISVPLLVEVGIGDNLAEKKVVVE